MSSCLVVQPGPIVDRDLSGPARWTVWATLDRETFMKPSLVLRIIRDREMISEWNLWFVHVPFLPWLLSPKTADFFKNDKHSEIFMLWTTVIPFVFFWRESVQYTNLTVVVYSSVQCQHYLVCCGVTGLCFVTGWCSTQLEPESRCHSTSDRELMKHCGTVTSSFLYFMHQRK